MASSLLKLGLLASVALLSSGCTLMPRERPTTGALPEALPAADAAPDVAAPGVWWNAFSDPTLKQLTAEGLEGNIPVRQAVLRVTRARAQSLQDIARYLPNFSADAQAQYTRVLKGPQLVGSFTSFIEGGGGTIARESQQAFYSTGPSVSWELPLFGLIPLSAKGARLNNQIATEDVRAATVALVGDVADAYIDLRAAQNREAVLEKSLANSEQLARLLESTVASGFTAPVDAADARRQAESTRARVPDARIQTHIARSTLAVLRGKAPGTEDQTLGPAIDSIGPIPTLALDTPKTAPADLLRARPDVARAEREALLAAVAVGAARHQLLPKATISGNVGLADNLIGSPLPEQQGQLQVTPFITMPLFDFGSKLAEARARKADFRISLLAYRDTVNRAVDEAGRALVSLENAKARLAAASAAEQAATKFSEGARASQKAGLTSLRDRLQAEQLLLEAELTRIEAEAAQGRASSAVYRAFAGALAPGGPAARQTARNAVKTETR